MTRYIEAPNNVTNISNRPIFLAGGITGCPNWQEIVKDRLLAETDLVLLNPRRENWTFSGQSQEEEDKIQISWEHIHLKYSDMHLYWFPAESICPIALFELGKSLGQNKKVFVGCHPDYPRRRDLEIQCELEGVTNIHLDLNTLVDEIVAYTKGRTLVALADDHDEPTYRMDVEETVVFELSNGKVVHTSVWQDDGQVSGAASYANHTGILTYLVENKVKISGLSDGWYVLEQVTGYYYSGDRITTDDLELYFPDHPRPATEEELKLV